MILMGKKQAKERTPRKEIIEQIELGQVKRLVIGYQDRGESFSPEEELVRDLIAIVTVFSARLHGLRSHKNLIRAAALGKDLGS